MFSCLICRGEKRSSSRVFFFFFFFSHKPWLREGDKSLLFSVAKRTTGGFSAESTGLVGGEIKKRGEEEQVRKGGEKGNVRGKKRESTAKSRSSVNRINCNQLPGTSDGIASLKIQ